MMSQFTVRTMSDEMIDIILGSNCMERLVTFTFNAKENFLTLFYKKKKITSQYFKWNMVQNFPHKNSR